MKIILKYLLVSGILFIAFNSYSQEQADLRSKANKLYNEFQYSKAVVLYTQLASSKKPRIQDMTRLAEAFRKMNNYDSAELWYSKLINHPESENSNLLIYANILKQQGKLTEAKENYRKYAQLSGTDISQALASCDSSESWVKNPTSHIIRNENTINTGLSEFSPAILGTQFFYTSEYEGDSRKYGWTGNSYLKLFETALDTASMQPGVAAVSYSKAMYHVGPITGNIDDKLRFVTRTYGGNEVKQEKSKSGKVSLQHLELIIYTRTVNGGWEEIPFKYNGKDYSVGHAAISPDGMTLYYISNMPGSYGGNDLWFSSLSQDGEWSAPKNCGPVVNTSENETFPSISKDGTLFFSSNGHTGMGGLDIFTAKGSNDIWSSPTNLKYPLNSHKDDFGYIEFQNEMGTNGFLSSNRNGGKGSDDIYSFKYAKPKVFKTIVQATFIDKKTKAVVDNIEAYYDVNEERIKLNLSTPGRLEFDLKKNSTILLKIMSKGYFSDSIRISTNDLKITDTMSVSLNLVAFEKGKTFKLDNIFYDKGKDDIREDAGLVLNTLETLLRENPSLKIELSSHTDSRGKDALNLILSQRRAQAAVNYLISRGIASDRLAPKGYGEIKLLNKCGDGVKCSDEEHQRNRRTEFTIINF